MESAVIIHSLYVKYVVSRETFFFEQILYLMEWNYSFRLLSDIGNKGNRYYKIINKRVIKGLQLLHCCIMLIWQLVEIIYFNLVTLKGSISSIISKRVNKIFDQIIGKSVDCW